MISQSFPLKRTLRLGVCACLPLLVCGQIPRRVAPVPRDPLELVAGPIQAADAPDTRAAALELLGRARKSFALRSSGPGYDLKVSFTVDSSGETNYDGAWQMEDIFARGLGHRWTATAASGYTTTGIATSAGIYGDGTSSSIPLRLQEARGVLFDPLQSPAYAGRGTIRTASATFRGATVTCLLFSRVRDIARLSPGRDWEETEECIDPQSGLLQMHSEVPGRYAVFNYENGPSLAGHSMPGSITITEGGRTVSRISVESLRAMSGADPALFVPTDAMKAKGPAVAMSSATKISRVQGLGRSTSTLRPVCVFGLVTPTGHLVEAHTLQPADPNSQAALEDAKKINFSPLLPAGTPPQQHFVFVIEKFATP